MAQAIETYLTPPRAAFWRLLQGVFFGVGLFILIALLLKPELGLHVLWNVLIPVAPALLVLAPGLWRNVCPMGTASMIPHHLRLSSRRQLNLAWQSRLLAGAVILLIVIVPLRPVLLDHFGQVTGLVLIAVALLAGGMGFVFDRKSFWCSGLCPVYPVEMLYGSKPAVQPRNAHCGTCSDCVSPCRDSRSNVTPIDAARSGPGRWATLALIGGFPGFIIGWYLIPKTGSLLADSPWPLGGAGAFSDGRGQAVVDAYAYSLGGMAISLAVFAALAFAYPRGLRGLSVLFATAAVSAYYWFKLPVMLGLGAPESALVPGLDFLPAAALWPLRVGVVVLFAGLLLARRPARGWLIRPPKA